MPKEDNSIRTPLFRVAFPSVFKKRKYGDDGKEVYEINCLFPKDTDLSALKAMAAAAAKAKWPQGVPKGIRNPFRDGDEKEYDGYAGMTYIRASSDYQPKIINLQGEPLLTEEEFYAGCWAYAKVNAFAYDTAGNKGVSFGLRNILFVRDDEPFSGRSKPEEDFADLIEVDFKNKKRVDGDGAAAPGEADEDIFA